MKRNNTLDIMKGIAIVLVVLGHAIVSSLSETEALKDITFNIIYSFHMPLFFLVAGYLLYKTTPKQLNFLNWIKGKAVYLLVPHYLMDIFTLCLVAFGISQARNLNEWIINAVLYLQGEWFLWTMFFVLLILLVLIILERKGKEYFWLGLVLIFIFIYFNASSSVLLGIVFINWQLPFALIGLLIAKYSDELKHCWYVIPIGAISYLPIMYSDGWLALIKQVGIGNLFGGTTLYFKELAQALTGICFVYCVSYLLNKSVISKPFSWLGRYSFAVYFLSGFFLYFGLGNNLTKTISGFLISLALSVVVILVLRYVRLLNRWIPASSIIKEGN